jgi:hypothetical protein
MATVTVTPAEFSLVMYDSGEIEAIARRLLDDLGLDVDLRIEVDETTPLGRVHITSLDPVVIAAESGALEDPKHPRHLSAGGTADVLGRLLFRVRDRRDPSFGDPPPDDDLPLAHSVAWDAYAIGRLVRLGYRHYDNRQRRLYHFRNRHGFSDASDDAFSQLWERDDLRWDDLVRLSDTARAAAPAPTS